MELPYYRKLPVPEGLNKDSIADGLRDMEWFSRPVFGGRSVVEPEVARTTAEPVIQLPKAPKKSLSYFPTPK